MREGDNPKKTATPTAAPATHVDAPADDERTNEVRQTAHMEPHDDRQNRNADYWNERLQEDHFHDVVNEDDQMYDDIEAVPMDGDNMVNHMLAIVKTCVGTVIASSCECSRSRILFTSRLSIRHPGQRRAWGTLGLRCASTRANCIRHIT